jgi:hypothetical protein
MTKKKDAPPPTPKKSAELRVTLETGKSADRQFAEMAARGLASNALTLVNFSRGGIGELSLTDCVAALRDQGTVNRGDMRDAEAMLAAQMAALNAMFNELARRAAINMGEHLGATDTYVRLALRAQSQCRATAEALAEIKNPRPVAFVKQANISNGPQQVNNGAPSEFPDQYAQARARGRKTVRAERTFRGCNRWPHATGQPSNASDRPN